jgi:hypothetical protein
MGHRRKRSAVFAAARAVRAYLPLLPDFRVAQAQRPAVFAVRTAGPPERPDLEIGTFVGPSFDYDIETLKGVARLRQRRGARFRFVNLGGLRIRRGEELTAWIEERRSVGIVGFHASLAGYGERRTTAGTAALAISITRCRSCGSPASAG